MSRQFCFTFLLIFLLSFGFSQKKETLEQKVTRLEKTVDSLRWAFRFHSRIYNHNDIEESKLTAALSLRLNRNFVYGANFYEAEPDTKEGNGYQRIFYFIGFRSAQDTREQLAENRSRFFEAIRTNLKVIKEIVVGESRDQSSTSDEYKVYPNRLLIRIIDNAGSSDELIVADTFLNSLKVRIDGVLQEVGWE